MSKSFLNTCSFYAVVSPFGGAGGEASQYIHPLTAACEFTPRAQKTFPSFFYIFVFFPE